MKIEKESCQPFTRAVFVIAKYHDLLHRLGLDSIEGVKAFQGELIKNHKGRRDIQRVTGILPGRREQAPILYLKRNWQPYKKDGLHSLVTRGQVWSLSRVEWENTLALQRAGITVAEPIACGEVCGLFWEKFSFILTAAANGDITLEEFLKTSRDVEERHRVIEALAKEIRKMHDAGLASPDLFTRHIFVERGREPRFCLIDMARLDRRERHSAKLRARDLAALNITAPLRFVTKEERRVFHVAYGGDAQLKQMIDRRMEHLLKRRKFADFTSPGHQCADSSKRSSR
ncbi:MAG TPA: lipopolysaccharide kinase InaA family protein [Candidatus Acidoferrum sp.]|nr:lipopolysaccharide kinase InaA family protein [Candidatus Acidoferrum sp.]